MSLTQRVTDLATRIGQEVKLKPSKSVNEVITGKWDMAQQGIQIGASLTAPNSGYIGFAAKADGLYQKIGPGSELRLLTETDASTYAPIGITSAALPAAAGWYRIATSAVGMNLCSGDFEIKWSISGAHGIANIYASIMYGQNPSLNMDNYSHYNSTGFTKTRIVYHTTYGGNYAYLEVYNASAIALQVSVKMMKNTGWTLLSPDTAGSIPSGYSTTEITFVDGIATEGQLASFVATGIAPLSVASTTVVGNLNADLLDGNHASAFSLAAHTHTGIYQPLHANLSGIAGLPIMPGLVRTDGAGNWSLDTSPYVVGTPWQGEGYIKDSDFASTGLMTRTGAGTYTITPTNTYSLASHNHVGIYQPVDADLTAIAGLAGVLGFLVKTNTNIWSLDTSTYALSTHTHAGAYEPVLGNPGTNGHILSSTTAGVRSWGALPLASSTVRGGILITGGTPAPGTLPISLYNESPYVGLTASAIEYVLTSASITSHKHDTLYAKLAGLTTQAFATANLGVTGTLTINKQGDGAQLLVFSTERAWNLSQYSTGASTELRLNDSTGGKIFRIFDSINGGNVAISNGGITASGAITAPSVKLTTGAGAGKILTSDADGDAIWSDPSSSFSAASETAPGAVEIATTAEVLAMSDMLRSITPYTLANAFPNSSGNNGYISLPIGFGERMIIQYGSFSANGNGTVSFPIAFPLYCHSVVITAGDGIARIPSKTRFSFTWNDVADAVTSANPCYWLAIGK